MIIIIKIRLNYIIKDFNVVSLILKYINTMFRNLILRKMKSINGKIVTFIKTRFIKIYYIKDLFDKRFISIKLRISSTTFEII